MPITVDITKFKSAKAALLRQHIRPFTQVEMDSQMELLRKGIVDYDAIKREWTFKEEVTNAINAYGDILDKLTAEVHFDLTRVAYQHVQITAAMLGASDDPLGVSVTRSVLTTASQSPYEFNWMQSGGARGYKVVLGPGDGSVGHDVIIDRDDHNVAMIKMQAVGTDSWEFVSTNVARPYGVAGLKLQFGSWIAKDGRFEFWPTSLSEGGWAYLEQTLPMVQIT